MVMGWRKKEYHYFVSFQLNGGVGSTSITTRKRLEDSVAVIREAETWIKRNNDVEWVQITWFKRVKNPPAATKTEDKSQ